MLITPREHFLKRFSAQFYQLKQAADDARNMVERCARCQASHLR